MTNLFEFFCSHCTIVERGNSISDHCKGIALQRDTTDRNSSIQLHALSNITTKVQTLQSNLQLYIVSELFQEMVH